MEFLPQCNRVIIGEAEYFGMVKGSSVGLGMQSVLRDFDIEVQLTLQINAGTAVAIASRRRLGKARRMEVCQVWLQEEVRKHEKSRM